MEIVIATSNTHKVLQLREILKELAPKATLLSLFDFPQYRLPPHDMQKSFAENAKIKAQDAASTLGKCCLCEQWGLVIPAFNDAVKAIFAKELGTRYAQALVAQTKLILALLAGKGEYDRMAYLESCVACVTADGKVREATARTEGYIADEERGKGNFGFDTIFIKHDYMKTLAELSPSVQSRISHRRKAIEKMLGFLEMYC